MKKEIHSERLLLRRIDKSDAAFVFEILNSKEWLQFIGDRNVHSIPDAEKYIQTSFLDIYKKYDFGFYAVVDKSTDCLIGICGITKREELEFPDLGYALLKKYTGKGYATEATRAFLNEIKSEGKQHKLLASIDFDNERSILLIKKLGFQFSKEVFKEDVGKVLNYYMLDLESYVSDKSLDLGRSYHH